MQDFSKKIVSLVLTLNILFTISVLYLFLQTGNEPDSLIMAWFAFTTGELWMLSSIKKKKIERDNLSTDSEEQEGQANG